MHDPQALNAPFLTVAELAARYKVTPLTVYDWIRRGELKAIRLGSRKKATIRIPYEEVCRFEGRPC